MIWSNWQGAIGRGAIVVLLFWTGLAWTQSPPPRPAGDGAERIMVVHENGKSTRCKVMESWQLPDGRIAHLLQSLDSGEMITIVDEQSSAAEPMSRNLRSMPKRIFSWGTGKRTPPEGSPIPPQLRIDSGIVIRNELPLPVGGIPANGPVIVNQFIDEKAVGGGLRHEGSITLFEQKSPPPIITNVSGPGATPPMPANAQHLEFPNAVPNVLRIQEPTPQIVNLEPKQADAGVAKPLDPHCPPSAIRPPVFPRINALLGRPGVDAPCEPGTRTPGPWANPALKNPKTPGPNGAPTPQTMTFDSTKPHAKVGQPTLTPIDPSGIRPAAVQPNDPTGVRSADVQPNDPTGVKPAGAQSNDPNVAKPGPLPSAPNVGIAPLPVDPNVANPGPLPSAPNVGIAPLPVDPNVAKPGPLPGAPNVGIAPLPIDPNVAKPGPLPSAPNVGIAPLPIDPNVAKPGPLPSAPNPGVAPLPVDPNVAKPGPLPSAPNAVGQPQPIDPSGVRPAPATNPVTPAAALVGDPSKQNLTKGAEPAAKKPWRPGDVLFGWMKKEPTPTPPAPAKTDPFKSDDSKKSTRTEDLLAKESKFAEKKIADRMDKLPKVPFSTNMAQSTPPEIKKPEASPLSIATAPKAKDEKPAIVPPLVPSNVTPAGALAEANKPNMWGTGSKDAAPLPGKTLLDPASLKAEVVKLPDAPVGRTNDPLSSPERYVPKDDRLKSKAMVMPAVANSSSGPEPKVIPIAGRQPAEPTYPPQRTLPHPSELAQQQGMPLGAQSVLAAKSNVPGQITYVPVPMMTTPQPNNPPMPPPPNMPEAPQLNAQVNAFSQPAAPRAAPAPQTAASVPAWMQPNPQAMMQQQMMQQYLMQQQMMQQQQQMMMAQAYRPNPYMNPYMNPYGPSMQAQGPMGPRNYSGPAAPMPYNPGPAMASGYAPASYPPMMPMHSMMPPQQPMVQPVSYQPMPTPQLAITQQVEQLIKVMRESPYPAQREWAAQSLTSFEWRAHPQVVPALLSSASQDPAASVRAGCVNCLGRMGAAVEPVFGTLHSMRNDIDPRVRQEVEQAFVRLGQSPMAPQQ